MEVLEERLEEAQRQKFLEEQQEFRSALIGSGDRSEKIRTYNFPQNRITDHRINFTLFGIESMLKGELVAKFIEKVNDEVRQKQIEEILN